MDRVKPLEPLLRFAWRLRGYSAAVDPSGTASVWELDLPDARLTLALSPKASRGLPGCKPFTSRSGVVVSWLIP